MASDNAQAFLEFVVKSLVEFPDDVKVAKSVDEMGVLMTLDLNPADMGKVIGRKGATAKAIRTLLRTVGMQNNARVNLKINEPVGGTGGSNMGMGSAPAGSVSAASTSEIDEAIAGLKEDMNS